MTTLSTSPVEDPDQLALIADDWTPLAVPFADAFKEACRAEALASGGWVNPNAVRARLIAQYGADGFNPRQLSALWSSATGTKSGYLDTHRDVVVPITGEGSRGNHNKSVPMRRWRS